MSLADDGLHYVVLWRHNPDARWHVHPFVMPAREADTVGRRLMAQFGGEAWSTPVALPTSELGDR